jgi:hypothetical protein
MTYGIDPGKSGAIVLLNRDGTVKATDPMPLEDADLGAYLSMIVDDSKKADVWIERIPKYAGKAQSGSSVATLFSNYRYIVGYLQGRGVNLQQVVPQVWMKPYRLQTKDWAMLTYPQRKKVLHEFALSEFFTDKENIPRQFADAALIALHGHRMRCENQHTPTHTK